MKRLIFFIAIATAAICASWSPASASDADYLREKLINCPRGEDCDQALQQEAEEIFDRVGNRFDDDFVNMGNEISVNHCKSLIEEMLYHMEKLKPYYNFKDVFYLEKLQKLKKNRGRFDAGEIAKADFERISAQIDIQYKDDIRESQEFIDGKVLRLKELCSTLNQTVGSVQDTARVKGRPVDESLQKSVLNLRQNKTWSEFESGSREGQKIEKSISMASNNMGKDLVHCLKGMFAGFEAPMEGVIFSVDLIHRLELKHPM
jgi:hypothetical protein